MPVFLLKINPNNNATGPQPFADFLYYSKKERDSRRFEFAFKTCLFAMSAQGPLYKRTVELNYAEAEGPMLQYLEDARLKNIESWQAYFESNRGNIYQLRDVIENYANQAINSSATYGVQGAILEFIRKVEALFPNLDY